ncbi:MAG TPA: outer membrane beta-barrel protein [Steroidobacteraceae bacterium]|nr:outer membrane beta-barrel protein [Steroidobacteraceae bacterium]
MKRIGVLGQLLLLGMFAHGAQAAEQVTTGWYLGASAGGATHDVSKGGAQDTIVLIFGVGNSGGVLNLPRTTLDTDSDSTGWRGLAGYRFHRNFAVELEYLDFGSSRIDETYVLEDSGFFPPGPFTFERHFTTDVSGPAVSALGKLPVGAGFELFVRAGVLFADSKIRGSGNTFVSSGSSATYADRVLFGGAGVDWNFAGRWSARLEYERSKDIERNDLLAESHVELLSLGVLFRL